LAISSSTRKAGPFLGNDATTVFPFAFKVFTTADLRVVRTNALGVESDLVLDTDYTVTLNSNQDNDPGGTVTRGTALPTGERLTITSDVEALQPLVLTNNGGFYPRVINDAFDKITIIAQQLIEQVGRSLKLPISSTASATLPDPVANRLIAWNSSANGFTNVNPASIATVAAYADAYIDLFTGNGTQTAFTLTHDPAVLANLSVSISGVVQVGGEDFTWVGTTLTFVVAPPTGTRIQVRYTRAIPPADLASAVAAAEADRVATAADRVQTGLDRIATAADVVSAEADRVATAADAVATAADRVQTGLDRVQTGTDVATASSILASRQPLDADLTAIAALTSAADKMPYATGAQAWALTDLTSFARALLATASNSAFLTALGNIAGTFVNFLQAGTGAVTRTGQAKMRDTISVFDYMTTAQIADVQAGTLAEDVTAAIQAAIDYAHSLSLGNISVPYDTIRKGGATVFFPAGAYKTTATVVLKEGVVLNGAGRFSTIIKSSANSAIIRNQTPLYYDAFGMGIKNMCLQGDRSLTSQYGVGLLRDWMGEYDNVSIVETGGNGWRLYQCISTVFRNTETLECVGRGVYVTDGMNSWEDTTLNNLPSNNISWYDPHNYGNDGAGFRFEGLGSGIGVMGCQTHGGSSEYNYKSSTAGTGANIELINTNSPVPNVFDTHWCEDDKVREHILVNLGDPQEIVTIRNLKHFGSGASSWPQKAVNVVKGFADIIDPVGSASEYRTYLGTNAPFQLTKLTAIIRLTNPRGSSQNRASAWVADETGATTNLANQLYQSADGVWRGNQQKVYTYFGEIGPEWLREGATEPYLRLEPFYNALSFGDSSSAPDVSIHRSAVGILTLRAGKAFNAERFDHVVVLVADLPTATVGRRAFVSDATATTFASIVAGGGANPVPVYADGTNWRIG
jgi:hypothetical protein